MNSFVTLRRSIICCVIIIIWEIVTWISLIYLSYHHGGAGDLQTYWLIFSETPIILGIPFLIVFGLGDFIYRAIKTKKITLQNFQSLGLILIPLMVLFLLTYLYYDKLYMFQVSSQIQDAQFVKQFDEYDKMVKTIQSGQAIKSSRENYFLVPRGFPANGIEMPGYGAKEDNNYRDIKIIMFLTSGGMPGVRGGYLYIPNEKDINEFIMASDWKVRRIKPNWYAFWG